MTPLPNGIVQHSKIVFVGKFDSIGLAQDRLYSALLETKAVTGPMSRNLDAFEVHERSVDETVVITPERIIPLTKFVGYFAPADLRV